MKSVAITVNGMNGIGINVQNGTASAMQEKFVRALKKVTIKIRGTIMCYIVYKVYYGDQVVYVGRTKQPLQNRMRGHLFRKPMHRVLDINQITKVEYAEFQTEADMNLYEIYYILTMHPPLNVDDKTKDYPTVTLPNVEFKQANFSTWDKWKTQLNSERSNHDELF